MKAQRRSKVIVLLFL